MFTLRPVEALGAGASVVADGLDALSLSAAGRVLARGCTGTEVRACEGKLDSYSESQTWPLSVGPRQLHDRKLESCGASLFPVKGVVGAAGALHGFHSRLHSLLLGRDCYVWTQRDRRSHQWSVDRNSSVVQNRLWLFNREYSPRCVIQKPLRPIVQ